MSTGASTLKSTIKATSFMSGRMQTLLRLEGVIKSFKILLRLEGGHTKASEKLSHDTGDEKGLRKEDNIKGEPK